MTTTAAPTRRAARVITELTSPAITATGAIIAVAISDAHNSLDSVWVSLAIVLVVALPMAFIVIGARKGRWRDHHIGDRESRIVPLLVATVGVIAAVMLLSLSDASRAVLAVVIAMLVGLLVVLLITRWWKVSIHSAVAGGLVAVLIATYGPWWLISVLAIGLVAWSRVVLDDHTPAQAVVGAVVGTLVAAVVFPPLH